jgi:hypothetical protein
LPNIPQMKSAKLLSPEAAAHAGQIGDLLKTTVANAGNSAKQPRVAAAAWWAAEIARLAQNFKQGEW